ncbi:hypothetical protein HF882_22945 [Victivallis vadensis]|uniref:Helix-turn-helix protein n=1 Tax=Victivallis vadensis TaxID=172901 RepID=A0A848B0N8_9BACT|nr:hypothetical protein [Victivallis vadensis]NMD89444.1 hypothetical protein [Victivallis vadensis]
MTTEEFKMRCRGLQAERLAELLLCSRWSIDKYRTGSPIPEKVARRVDELDKLLEQFCRTNFPDE